MTDRNVCPPGNAPELMAPAGDWDCARAAVENGADAVYFGTQGGFNARAKAANFGPEELPGLMTFLRTRGVKGYLTLNTLVFGEELDAAEQVARAAVAAGVDAVLVQDLGLLRLLHRLCPALPLHASTQMTLSSAECIHEVESLGVRRVVLPRELSIEQIAAIRRHTNIELEVFVHGALCVSYSGQCLASRSMGGRSANRGQCAQPCRLPYEACGAGVPPAQCSRDGRTTNTRGFLLSPHDLAAYDRLPALLAAGVSALKIEGRLKPAEYVASVTRNYRTALDAAMRCPLSPWERARVRADYEQSPHPLPLSQKERGDVLAPEDIAEMELAFSRGFCHGWLDGPNGQQSLISGQTSAKRGTLVGEIRGVRGDRILVELSASVRRGDGLVFQGDRSRADEQGGRVYEIFIEQHSVESAAQGDTVEMAFRYGAIDRSKIELGQRVWKTDDPQANRRMRKTYDGKPRRRVSIDLTIEAAVGSPLSVMAVATTGVTCRIMSPEVLPQALKHPLTAETLTEQFSRLGGTTYELRRLEAKLDGQAMIPLSVLGKLRHELVAQLDAAAELPPPRAMLNGSAPAALRAEGTGGDGREAGEERHVHDSPFSGRACPARVLPVASGRWPVVSGQNSAHSSHQPLASSPSSNPQSLIPNPLSVDPSLLCRSMAQIESALACGVTSVVADFHEIDLYGRAVRVAHAEGASILLATPRIHQPGESRVFDALANDKPDGILVRNLAGMAFFRQAGLPIVADFSLNAVNDLTIAWLHAQGACRVTAAYDLSGPQLLALAAVVPPEWLEVVVHRHTPMFHTEYCLFRGLFSQGKSKADCGQPCRRQRVRLRDRLGVEHPLSADSQCRNTLFHAEAETCWDIVPRLCEIGVRHFRIELLDERSPEEVGRTIAPWRSLQNAPGKPGR